MNPRMDAEQGSGEFWLDVFQTASDQIFDQIIKPGIDVTLSSGYPPMTQPTTVKDLLKLSPEEAGLKLEGMMMNTQTNAEGRKLFAAYLKVVAGRQQEVTPFG
jgi:hypothetical protein